MGIPADPSALKILSALRIPIANPTQNKSVSQLMYPAKFPPSAHGSNGIATLNPAVDATDASNTRRISATGSSKKIVSLAKCTGRAIAIEELTGIRNRIKARKRERATQQSWSFAQLGGFISYKAEMAGVPVIEVDPYFTSQRCSECGYTNKKNRKTRDDFCCGQCGHTSHADENGAQNIRLKGLDALRSGDLNHPIAEVTGYATKHDSIHSQSSSL